MGQGTRLGSGQELLMATQDSKEGHGESYTLPTTIDETTTLLLPSKKEPEPSDGAIIRTYWWRWVVLAVFVLNLGLNNFMWITFGPIADVVRCYYSVSDFWVNSLSMTYMVTYIALVFPCSWLLDKVGLRTTTILGSFATVLGACLRLAGSGPDHFWLLLVGQTIAAVCNVLIWGAPSLLSEIWFPESERATATAIGGGISPQLGVMLAFALSPVLVVRSDTNEVCGNDTHQPDRDTAQFADWSHTISNQLFYYLLGQTVLTLAVYLLTFIAYPEAPPNPPSISRKLENSSDVYVRSFWPSLLKAFKNVYFLLFLLTSGINLAASGALNSVINEVIHPYFKNYDEDIGYMGLVAVAVSIVAMLAVGRLLDWTKAFYAVAVALFVLGAAGLAGFSATVLFQNNFIVVCVAFTIFTAATTSFAAIAYEYAVEMTYPLPESTSAGLVNVSSQVISIVLIVVVGQFANLNVSMGLWFMTGVLAFGALVTLFIRPELRRVKVDNPTKYKSLTIQDNLSPRQ